MSRPGDSSTGAYQFLDKRKHRVPQGRLKDISVQPSPRDLTLLNLSRH